MEINRFKIPDILKVFAKTIHNINRSLKLFETPRAPTPKEVKLIMDTHKSLDVLIKHLEVAKVKGKVMVPDYMTGIFTGRDKVKASEIHGVLMQNAVKFKYKYDSIEKSLELVLRSHKKSIATEEALALERLIDETTGGRGSRGRNIRPSPMEYIPELPMERPVRPEPLPDRQPLSGPIIPRNSSKSKASGSKYQIPEFVKSEIQGSWITWKYPEPLGAVRFKKAHLDHMYRKIEYGDIELWLDESKAVKSGKKPGLFMGWLMLTEDIQTKLRLNTDKVDIWCPYEKLQYGVVIQGERRVGKTVKLHELIVQLNEPKPLGSKSIFPKPVVILDPKPDFNPQFRPYRQSLVPAYRELMPGLSRNELLYAPLGRPNPPRQPRHGHIRPLPSPNFWKMCLPPMLQLDSKRKGNVYAERFMTFLSTVNKPMSVAELRAGWRGSSYHAQMSGQSSNSIDASLDSLFSNTYLFTAEDYTKPHKQRKLVNYTPIELCHTMNTQGHRFAICTVIRMGDRLTGGSTMSARMNRHEIGLFATAVIGEIVDFVQSRKVKPPIIIFEEAQQGVNEDAPVTRLCKDLQYKHSNLGIPLWFVLQKLNPRDFQIDQDLISSINARLIFKLDMDDEEVVKKKYGYKPEVIEGLKNLPPGAFYLDVSSMPKIPLLTGNLDWVIKIYHGATNI